MPDHDIDSEYFYPPAKWAKPKSGVEMVEDAMMSIDKVRDLIAASAKAGGIEPITSGEYGALIANPVHVDAVMIDGDRYTVLRQKAHDTWPDGSEYYATVYLPAYALAVVSADVLKQPPFSCWGDGSRTGLDTHDNVR